MLRRLLATAAFAFVLGGPAPLSRGATPTPAAPPREAQQGSTDNRGGIYDPALDARVEELLRKMTLEEKVGQLVQYSSASRPGPARVEPTTRT